VAEEVLDFNDVEDDCQFVLDLQLRQFVDSFELDQTGRVAEFGDVGGEFELVFGRRVVAVGWVKGGLPYSIRVLPPFFENYLKLCSLDYRCSYMR
jgi:hypothetical protein